MGTNEETRERASPDPEQRVRRAGRLGQQTVPTFDGSKVVQGKSKGGFGAERGCASCPSALHSQYFLSLVTRHPLITPADVVHVRVLTVQPTDHCRVVGLVD
jgi:hypothetical protein